MPSLEVVKARGRTPMNEDELKRMAAAAWHKDGILVVDPAKINNDFDRQFVVTIANKLFGRRSA